MSAGDPLALPERFNGATPFLDARLECGDAARVALRCGAERRTYGDVAAAAESAARAMAGLGVRREERVAMLVADRPEFAAFFFGAIRGGIVPVPLSTLLVAEDYRYMLADMRARLFVVDPAFAPMLDSIRGLLGSALPPVLLLDEAFKKTLWEGAPPATEPAPTHRDEPAFWLYSSGSTGKPKGVVHLHHDMLFCAELYARRRLGVGRDDVAYSVAKLFFAYGLGNGLYFPMYAGGAAVLLPERPTPAVVVELCARERPTLFYGVPTFYAAMLAWADAGDGTRERVRSALNTVRAFVSAGESLPPVLWERWHALTGRSILDGIGSTEALHIFISNPLGAEKPGSSGTLVDGYEAKIVDEHGAECGAGESGELQIAGDSTAPMYWNQHAKTKATMLGRWLCTGDRYRRDESGYYWHEGRVDDVMKVSGLWVSPVEVEAAVLAHPDVLECAVVGAFDDDRLLKPKAFVVPKAHRAPDDGFAAELQQFVKDRIAIYKYPRWIEFADELPKTATGKIQRFRLRDPRPIP